MLDRLKIVGNLLMNLIGFILFILIGLFIVSTCYIWFIIWIITGFSVVEWVNNKILNING